MGFLALILFLIVLAHRGRLGPFAWDRAWRQSLPAGHPHRMLAAPAASRTDAAERILASRLADGEISPDDYLERLSLIQAR